MTSNKPGQSEPTDVETKIQTDVPRPPAPTPPAEVPESIDDEDA